MVQGRRDVATYSEEDDAQECSKDGNQEVDRKVLEGFIDRMQQLLGDREQLGCQGL